MGDVTAKRIAIIGSRDYPHRDLVFAVVQGIASKNPARTIVSGGARGVDTWAGEAATACGLNFEIMHADWDHDGRAAGLLRNTKLVECVDSVVAFWDGTSRGTLDTLKKARKADKNLVVFGPDGKILPIVPF